MPGINDAPEQVEPLLEAIAEAGATNVAGIALHLRGEVRRRVHGLDEGRAARDLVPRYERLYGRRAYAPQPERERLARMVRRGARPARSGAAGASKASMSRPEPGIRRRCARRASGRPPWRASRRCSERLSACRAGRRPSAGRSRPSRSAVRRVAADLRCEAREGRAEAHLQGRHVDLALVALDRPSRPLPRPPQGCACRRPAGSFTSASANMPGVADEAREDGRDADAVLAQVRAQPRRRSRAGRTSSRCRARCPASRPCLRARR